MKALRNPNGPAYLLSEIRNKRGERHPRRIVSKPPLVQLNAEALRRVAEATAENPEDGRRLAPVLFAENAIAATENATLVGDAIASHIESENKRHRDEIQRLTPTISTLRLTRDRQLAELARLAARLPIKIDINAVSIVFSDGEPETLEATAARIGIPMPVKANKPFKIITIMASAFVLALAYGTLTDAYDLSNVSEHLGTFGIAYLVMGGVVYSTCAVFEPIGYLLGLLAGVRSIRSARQLLALEGGIAVITVLLATVISAAESTTEQVGLFMGLEARSSMEPQHTGRSDIFWITLLVVIPTVMTSTLSSFCRGISESLQARLIEARDVRRAEIRQNEAFQEVSALHQTCRATIAEFEECKAELEAHKQALRFEPTIEELRRRQDADEDLHAYSDRVEESLGLRQPSQDRHQRLRPITPRVPLLKRLFCALVGRSA